MLGRKRRISMIICHTKLQINCFFNRATSATVAAREPGMIKAVMQLQPRDQLDRKLLVLLEKDARMSASQIARELRIARSTVNDRIARLERDGVIQGYTTILAADPEASQTRALIFLKCERRMMKTITRDLRNYAEIRACYSTSGTYDLSCMVEVQYSEDLDALIDDVSLLDGIYAVESQMILATRFSRNTGLQPAKAQYLEVVK